MISSIAFRRQKVYWRRIKKKDISSWRPNAFLSYCLNRQTYYHYVSELCAKRTHKIDLPIESKRAWKIRKAIYQKLTLRVWEVNRYFKKLYDNLCWFIYIPDLVGMMAEAIIFMYRNFNKVPMHPNTRKRLLNLYQEIQSLSIWSYNDRMDTYPIKTRIMYEYESHQRMDIENIIDEWDDHEVVQEINSLKQYESPHKSSRNRRIPKDTLDV